MTNVLYECLSCHASGIYRGTQEPPDVGVVCNQCNGKGSTCIHWPNAKQFTGRKPRTDIKIVYVRITNRRGVYEGNPVSREDFYKDIVPS